MDADDIPYLLKRACAHRLLTREAKCGEARSIHRQFVRNYQRRLVAIRRSRIAPPGFAISAPIGDVTIGLFERGPSTTATAEPKPLLWGKPSIEEISA